MKKLSLAVIGMYLSMLSAYPQQSANDTSAYKSPVLKLDEVNLVSGYYTQQGNHSAVTGGIGTQQLNDLSNTLELKFVKWDRTGTKKYSLDISAGIDHHTSASQAYISKTGASSPQGTRIYPSVNWTAERANGLTSGIGLYYSGEYNYHSFGANFMIGKKSRDKATEINFKGQAFIDRVALIYPSELSPYITTISSGSRGEERERIPGSPRNTFSGALTISRIVNKNFQLAVMAEPAYQSGLLSLPFHRVYLNTGTVKVENLPSQRIKLPVAIRASYFLGDKIILRSYYRYFQDNWGVKAHTASLEVPYKLSPFFSIAPFYRFYTQTAANYFAPYKVHTSADQYYTSNYDLSAFKANLVGINFRVMPKTNEFIFDMIEVRASHYMQTTGLTANNIGLNLRFK